MAEADFFHHFNGFVEMCLRFARETHNDVRSQVKVGIIGPDFSHQLQKLFTCVHAAHFFQDLLRSALQTDVHVGRQLRVLE